MLTQSADEASYFTGWRDGRIVDSPPDPSDLDFNAREYAYRHGWIDGLEYLDDSNAALERGDAEAMSWADCLERAEELREQAKDSGNQIAVDKARGRVHCIAAAMAVCREFGESEFVNDEAFTLFRRRSEKWRHGPADATPPGVADCLRFMRSGVEAEAAEDDPEHVSLKAEPIAEMPPEAQPKLFRIGDLLSGYPNKRPPIIEGLLRETETMNVIGASKAGKSWLIAGLLMSVASGRQWLGFDTTPARVLLIDNELHNEELSSRLAKVAETMGISPSLIADSFDVLPLRGLRSDIGAIKHMTSEMVKSRRHKLIAIDAFYRILPEGTSENDNAQMTQVYNSLDAIAAETGAAIVLNHHSSKGDQSGKSVTDVGSGAGAISRAADSHIILRPHELDDCAVMEAVCRSWKAPEPLTLKWEWPLWKALEGVEPEIKRPKTAGALNQQKKDAESDAAVMRALSGAKGKRLTAAQLRGKTGFGPQRVDRTLARLRDAGQVAEKRAVNRSTGKRSTVFQVVEQADSVCDSV